MSILRLASVAFACVIACFSTAPYAQTTPDESLCDGLLGHTPSLYGLCLAYMAAKEKAGSLTQPPAVQKIFDKYEQARADDDPPLPGTCPCWTAEELQSWVDAKPEYPSCISYITNSSIGWFTNYVVGGLEYSANAIIQWDSGSPNRTCEGKGADDAESSKSEDLTEAQFEACYADVYDSLITLKKLYTEPFLDDGITTNPDYLNNAYWGYTFCLP